MYVDDLRLNNFLYAPSGPAAYYYNSIEDDFGKFILRNWLNGDGSAVEFHDGRWGEYISSNRHVLAYFKQLACDAINDGSMVITDKSSLALTNYGGGYSSGYELINGSNIDVGGFLVVGLISLVNYVYQVDLVFEFNDIIDPNKDHRSDSVLAFLSTVSGYACNDYQLRITGSYSFTVPSGIIH